MSEKTQEAEKKAADAAAAADASKLEEINSDAAKVAEKAASQEEVVVQEIPANAILEQPKEYVSFEDGKQFVTKTGEETKKKK